MRIDLSSRQAGVSRVPIEVEDVHVEFDFENESVIADSDLDELFKEVDEAAEYSKNYFVMDDGSIFPGFERIFDVDVEVVKNTEDSSSSADAANQECTRIVDSFSDYLPKTSGRSMTKEEIKSLFKIRAKDLMDQKIPIRGRFHEDIPCMPAGLTGA